MKILHTADLHLDAVMDVHFDPETAAKRRNELLETFRRMVSYAAQIGVRLVLITGDLFDTPRPTPATEQFVMNEIATHPEMDFFVLAGDHMKNYAPVDPPKNYHTFPARNIGYYRYENIVIGGTENNAAYHEVKFSPNDINIMMLHGQLSDAITDLSLINLKFWKNAHIDYLALGHVHRTESGALDERGTWAYCGTPEGRNFEENGTKGFRLLEVAGKKISSSFIPFAQRTLHTVTADISRNLHQHDIDKQVSDAVAALPAEDILRVVLRGVASPDMHMDLSNLTSYLKSRFFYADILNETNVSLRPETYARDKTLRGEFVRTVLASGLARADMERIIRCGIQALGGEEVSE